MSTLGNYIIIDPFWQEFSIARFWTPILVFRSVAKTCLFNDLNMQYIPQCLLGHPQRKIGTKFNHVLPRDLLSIIKFPEINRAVLSNKQRSLAKFCLPSIARLWQFMVKTYCCFCSGKEEKVCLIRPNAQKKKYAMGGFFLRRLLLWFMVLIKKYEHVGIKKYKKI